MRLYLEKNVSSVRVGHAIPDGLHQFRFAGTFVQDGQEKIYHAICVVFKNLEKIMGAHVYDVSEFKSGSGFSFAGVTWADKNVFAEAIISYLNKEAENTF